MDYIIAIPSYKRSEQISLKTLHVLSESNIPSEKIFIFVANNDEKKLYYKNVDSSLYNKIIVGVVGLRNQRNFICDYYDEGTRIVQIDDDIEEIAQMIEGETKKMHRLNKVVNLNTFFNDAFECCNDNQANLWGVYPVYNAYFMNKKITTDLRYIVGCLFGIINRKIPELKLTLNEKEDFERTILHFNLDSSVIRYNDIVIKTKYYAAGGMLAEDKDRKVEALKNATNLVDRFPMYCKLWLC